MTTNPYAPPQSVVHDAVQAGEGQQPAFFATSVTKLLVLDFCTLGLYTIYWFYKHWRIVQERSGEKMIPPLRAVFSVLFCYSLFRRVREHSPDLSSARLAAGPLAALWIVLSLASRLPDPLWVMGLLNVFALIPVQLAANTVNAAVAPDHDRNTRFSAWNWLVVALGVPLLALIAIGAFLPAD